MNYVIYALCLASTLNYAYSWWNIRLARRLRRVAEKYVAEAESSRPRVYKLDEEQAALFKAAMAKDAGPEEHQAFSAALKRPPKGEAN